MTLDFKDYVEKCKQRWHGEPLQDALVNWECFEEIKEDLTEAMKEFKRNPGQKDLAGKYHNPDYTLTSFLWKLQSSLQPDKHRLGPLLDFEEHFQKVFLRRGLIFYCSMILRELETPKTNPDQAVLNFDLENLKVS